MGWVHSVCKKRTEILSGTTREDYCINIDCSPNTTVLTHIIQLPLTQVTCSGQWAVSRKEVCSLFFPAVPIPPLALRWLHRTELRSSLTPKPMLKIKPQFYFWVCLLSISFISIYKVVVYVGNLYFTHPYLVSTIICDYPSLKTDSHCSHWLHPRKLTNRKENWHLWWQKYYIC